MPSRVEHNWTHLTEDGEKRDVRATKFGGEWRLQSKLRSQETWTYHDRPLEADLIALKDLLARKYSRGRVPYEDLKTVDRLIHEAAC